MATTMRRLAAPLRSRFDGVVGLLVLGGSFCLGASFREHVISTDLKMGYQMAVVDVNGDGKPDVIAVDERGTELAWYENPSWSRHVIAADVPRTINVDATDIDGDGVPEIAILYKFESRPDRSVGIVGLLHHDGDPARPWTMREIDRVPTAHRVRWADIDGSGQRVMIMGPMVGAGSDAPDAKIGVPVYVYRGPEWKRELLTDEPRGVLHGIYPIDWDGNGRQALLTASFLGLRLFRWNGDAWRGEAISVGDPEPCPKCGSSEITQGRLGKERFLAAIEPWHGYQVVVYRKSGGAWARHVIDDSFVNGHALATGDLDGDGRDEIVAGFRGQGFQLYVYRAADEAGTRWTREVLDPGGIAAADCKVRDLNGDGRADVVCIGASTHNLKWYENVGDIPASRPPMGWNSWDAYGTTVTEAEVKANADYMSKNLKQHGWEYIVVDIQWSEMNPKSHGYRADAELAMDANGRLIPAPNRFPSAADGRGFKPLADYVHSLGLKFGIHIMRGIPRRAVQANLPVLGGGLVRAGDIADVRSTCPWNSDMYGVDMSKPGAQAYYDSLLKLYADWGVDYIKADDIARPMHRDEIAALHSAIGKTGREIVLSLSPGPATVKDLALLQENANLWRISDDFWDDWRSVRQMFLLLSVWGGTGRPGAWPDADMLPLGHIGLRAERGDDRVSRFTHDEAQTVVSLWSIAQSPLMMGGDLPTSDAFTMSLLSNDEVLAVNQSGRRGYPFWQSGGQVAWVADAPEPNVKYLGVFNEGDRPAEVRVDWGALKMPEQCVLRDLWAKTDVGKIATGYTFRLPPHGSGLFRVGAAK